MNDNAFAKMQNLKDINAICKAFKSLSSRRETLGPNEITDVASAALAFLLFFRSFNPERTTNEHR